jgi:Flp pilus assembly protein TadG
MQPTRRSDSTIEEGQTNQTASGARVGMRSHGRGQVLVLFCLFLLVLLGVSAVGIDYASWLLMDRNLQNTADHAALAGASAFENRSGGTSCAGTKCLNARALAWTSLNDELDLGLSDTDVGNLAASDSLAVGVPITTATKTVTVWVATPPPTYAAYIAAGGQYSGNDGIVFVRVDRPVPSFLGGALGITPAPRTGWATAGAIPTGLALQTFCRNQIPPQGGVCENSAGVTIDGQGGIRLLKGDIGSNESLTVTANVGQGVQMMDGNVFVVNRRCGAGTWNCVNGPPSLGGINGGPPSYVGKSALRMAPLPVPRYESPVEYASLSVCSDTLTWNDTLSPNYHVPCVPYRNQAAPDPAPSFGQWVGDWACDNGSVDCGTPTVTGGSVTCGGGTFDEFYRPNLDSDNPNPRWQGSQYNSNAGGGNRYLNINDATVDPPGTLPGTVPGSAPLTGNPTNVVSSENGATNTYRVALDGVEGVHAGGSLTVRYVLFRTASFTHDSAAGTPVPFEVRLRERTAGNTYITRGFDVQAATEQITVYQFSVSTALMTGATWYNNLYLEFQATSSVAGRGVGISWAEVEEENLQPRQAPRIPPGYWKSITIPDGKCALLDPSHATGVQLYQLPGVFRFGGTDNGANAPRINIGTGAYLIGDGVSLVFDPRVSGTGFPDNGLSIGAGGALVINAGATSDPPLTALPVSGSSAAWQVDAADTTNPRNGENTWPVCTRGGNECVPRACYMNTDPNPTGVCAGQTVAPLTAGRGIAFYFTPNTWTHDVVSIQRRFTMGGAGETNAPGIAFQGVLYAPYDDVRMSGRNNFNTVGQVLAWTVKFNGGNAGIFLEYPYTDADAPPYLLEPTVD